MSSSGNSGVVRWHNNRKILFIKCFFSQGRKLHIFDCSNFTSNFLSILHCDRILLDLGESLEFFVVRAF